MNEFDKISEEFLLYFKDCPVLPKRELDIEPLEVEFAKQDSYVLTPCQLTNQILSFLRLEIVSQYRLNVLGDDYLITADFVVLPAPTLEVVA